VDAFRLRDDGVEEFFGIAPPLGDGSVPRATAPAAERDSRDRDAGRRRSGRRWLAMPSESISTIRRNFSAPDCVRIGAANGLEESVFGPIFGGDNGYDLLGENPSENPNGDAVRSPWRMARMSAAFFDEIVARRGEEAAFRACSAPVACAAECAGDRRKMERGEPIWQTEVDTPYIDPKFERGRWRRERGFLRL